MAQKKAPLFKEDVVIELPAVKLFNADEEFVDGKRLIWCMSGDFKNIIAGVTEHNIGKAVLVTRRLAQVTSIKEIAKAIGKRGAFSLAHLRALLNSQKQSFLVIVMVKGKVSAVLADWHAGYGWVVLAYPVDSPLPWGGGFQVLSRKSARNLVHQ